ncbi:MAG: keto-deoxy-phosphogluconate aldolase [Massilia sp.]|nr:keto-deoxy-phosphogluconate aldolase [Massilia sp.]
MTMTLLDIMRSASVIPVIAIDDPAHAVPLARALVEGGIRVLEVTLRTEHGLAAIRAMSEIPGAIVGVGVMAAREAGFRQLKLFPAVPAGGVGMLSAIGGPLPDVTFCPTGGISIDSAPQFLALKNVACVGGSWLTPKDAIKAGNWAHITELAKAAAALKQ